MTIRGAESAPPPCCATVPAAHEKSNANAATLPSERIFSFMATPWATVSHFDRRTATRRALYSSPVRFLEAPLEITPGRRRAARLVAAGADALQLFLFP